MLSLGTEALSSVLDDLRRTVKYHDLSRRHFLEEADLSSQAVTQKAASYLEAKRHCPRAATLQIYMHCASVTRLYAVYETYVYELARLWLVEICGLSEKWEGLPEALCVNYRLGIGSLLQKFGRGPRTAHLTEVKIVDSLHSALAGSNLELIPDAFFIDLQNLRESDLDNLLSRIGLSGSIVWLNDHPELRKHCEQYGHSVGSTLKELIEYRNDAAHGAIDVDEVIGLSEFLPLVDFIDVLCHALAEFVRHEVVFRGEKLGRYKVAARVTEFFTKPQASIAKMQRAITVKRGDTLLVRTDTRCYAATVNSIRADDLDYDFVDAKVEQELGVCFKPAVDRGFEVVVAVQQTGQTTSLL